jgi:uroporphyrinogen decarboxylase
MPAIEPTGKASNVDKRWVEFAYLDGTMMELDSRTRVKRVLGRCTVDRVPMHDAFWEDTLALWRDQGLGDADPCDFFEMDFDAMYLDLSGRAAQKVLAQDERKITIQDRAGYTVRKFIGKSRSMEFLDHITKDKSDWLRLRERLVMDPDSTGEARLDDRSYFMHMGSYPSWQEARSKYHRLRQRNRFLLFHAYGPWEATWRHRGIDQLLMDMALDPGWVLGMVEAHVDLLIESLTHCLDLGAKPDGLFLADDFGYTRGLLFSPEMWRKIFKPSYLRLATFLHAEDVTFWLHSCGDVRGLIPDLIDAGLDVLQPLQVAAGMDLRDLLSQFGQQLVFFGNISAAAMNGEAEPLEAEIREKLSLGRDLGGYIYHSDHSIPPEVTFDRYRMIIRWVKQYGQV